MSLANSVECGGNLPPGVVCREGMPAMLPPGYDHFGDADVYGAHLIVPVEGPGRAPLVAVFRISDLAFEGWDFLFAQQSNAAWLAVNPVSGRLFSSDARITNVVAQRLLSYPLDFGRLCVNGPGPDGSNSACWFLPADPLEVPLFGRQGSVNLEATQGGDWDSHGQLLFLSNGLDSCVGGDEQGLRVFEVENDVGILRAKSERNGYGVFNADVSCGFFSGSEEFEGVDFGDVPGFSGSLHLFVLDNEAFDNDAIFFKHYRF